MPTGNRGPIRRATDDLFSGAGPATIRQALLAAQKSGDFNCKKPDYAEFAYLFGLTYELTGDAQKTVDAYLELWRKYPDSPNTLMARAKLELVP